MEKLLWLAIVVLWLGLLAGSAVAAEPISGPTPPGVPVSSSAVPLVTSVRGPAVGTMLRPAVEPGRNGGAEFAGALVVSAALLWAARRHRIL